MSDCPACVADQGFLRSVARPDYGSLRSSAPLRTVDLFAGCGGLTLGLAEAARRLGRPTDVRLAVDEDKDACDVFSSNLPVVNLSVGKVEALFDGDLEAPPTAKECDVRDQVGEVHVLVGGPPCQGNSDLNNHTRRSDPRNALYSRMARAAEVLRPLAVLVENVPAVRRDHGRVLDATTTALENAGYQCADLVVDSSLLGVPQRRRRHVLLAALDDGFDPERLLSDLRPPCEDHRTRTVRWAIEDLERPDPPRPLDVASSVSNDNADRIAWLFQQDALDLPNDLRPRCHRSDHTYRSMYGRLAWDEPAQTVTTGFGSMGQGRYVHPSQRRTLTPHEAARLQTFPDFFDFGATRFRSAWARMIGNAVPPLLNVVIGTALIPLLTLPESSSVVQASGAPVAAASSSIDHVLRVGAVDQKVGSRR